MIISYGQNDSLGGGIGEQLEENPVAALNSPHKFLHEPNFHPSLLVDVEYDSLQLTWFRGFISKVIANSHAKF